jgi:HEPN domain-containing protein
MTLPRVQEARPFYRSAGQRFEDAEFLLEAGRTTGAIYLAGYSVECMLKALILCIVPPAKRSEMLRSFRGSKAHDYDWLKGRYFENGGPPLPSAVAKSFSLVDTWTTELRYKAGTTNPREAESFMQAAREILDWAEGRI